MNKRQLGSLLLLLGLFVHSAAWADTEHTLRADGTAVTYYLDLPSAQSYPVVVILQGSECLKVSHKYLEYIEHLKAQGVAVLRVEKPGLDENVPIGTCPPEYLELNTPERRVLDLLLVLSEIRRQDPRYDGSLVLTGGSEGAMVAALAAPLCQDLKALVLFSGGGGGIFGNEVLGSIRMSMESGGANEAAITARMDEMARQLEEIRREPVSTKEWLSDGELSRSTYRWWAQAWGIQLSLPLLKVEAPILALQGFSDENVPAASAELLAEKMKAAGRENFHLRTYQGGHGPPDEVVTESLDWALQQLR